jgi:hypothetical protein
MVLIVKKSDTYFHVHVFGSFVFMESNSVVICPISRALTVNIGFLRGGFSKS